MAKHHRAREGDGRCEANPGRETCIRDRMEPSPWRESGEPCVCAGLDALRQGGERREKAVMKRELDPLWQALDKPGKAVD